MTTYAKSGKPAYAVSMWADFRNIYLELPCISGPPYIQSFPLNEGGLSKALGLMRNARDKSGEAYSPQVRHPLVNAKRTKGSFSEGQREAARAALRKLNLIGD